MRKKYVDGDAAGQLTRRSNVSPAITDPRWRRDRCSVMVDGHESRLRVRRRLTGWWTVVGLCLPALCDSVTCDMQQTDCVSVHTVTLRYISRHLMMFIVNSYINVHCVSE